MTSNNQVPSRYGAVFDVIADRWAAAEAEHDQVHPDRSDCGGVGACEMMARAFDLREEMRDALEQWRKPAVDADRPMVVISEDEAAAVYLAINGATARGGLADLVRHIITAGRKTAVYLGEPRPVRRQYATLEAMEAAIAAGELPMPPAAVSMPVQKTGPELGAGDQGQPDVAGDRYDVMLRVIEDAGDNGLMPGAIMAEMIRRGLPWSRRAELYPALKRAVAAGKVVQPIERGRYHWAPQLEDAK